MFIATLSTAQTVVLLVLTAAPTCVICTCLKSWLEIRKTTPRYRLNVFWKNDINFQQGKSPFDSLLHIAGRVINKVSDNSTRDLEFILAKTSRLELSVEECFGQAMSSLLLVRVAEFQIKAEAHVRSTAEKRFDFHDLAVSSGRIVLLLEHYIPLCPEYVTYLLSLAPEGVSDADKSFASTMELSLFRICGGKLIRPGTRSEVFQHECRNR